MDIHPIQGLIIVSLLELSEKKETLIISSIQQKITIARVDKAGEIYREGEYVIFNPYKEKVRILENQYFMNENDIIARVTLSEEDKEALKPKEF